MAVQIINKSIKIIDSEVVRITKKFAENNLSKVCLKYADFKGKNYYEWTTEAGAYMVMYELPTIFKMEFLDVINMLSFYCPEYVEEMHLNSESFIKNFLDNEKKKIVY